MKFFENRQTSRQAPVRSILIILSAAVVLLSACGASGDDGNSNKIVTTSSLLPDVPQTIIDAAKKEGKVIVWSAVSVEGSKDLYKDAFEAAYPGIEVELYTAPGSDRDTRFMNEYKAGVAKVDLMVGSASGPNAAMKPAGMLQSIRPFLLPDVLDPSHWVNGTVPWADTEEKYFLQGDMSISPQLIINADIDPSEISEWSDLLDPKWRGKIVMEDPRNAGLGFAIVMTMMHAPELGPDFVDEFFSTMDVTFNNDKRQLVEWVEKGEKMIGLQPQIQDVEDLRDIGAKVPEIQILNVGDKPVGSFISSNGILFVPNLDPLPNPNAAKLYINWFYSQAGQQNIVNILGQNASRSDIDKSELPDYVLPKEGVDYVNANVVATPENVLAMRAAVDAALKKK